jgi:hypothetical protein
MAEFKNSNLCRKLFYNDMLTQDAKDFVDACMDDFCVDESIDGGTVMYELRGMLDGYYGSEWVTVTQTYYGSLEGMALLIEYFANNQ